VLAAHRAGLRTIILPHRNEPDIDDIPEEVRRELTFVFVDRMEEVLDAALSPRTTEPPVQPGNGRAQPDVQVQDTGEAVESVENEGG